jgi:lipopolysaccharide transport system permease protein
VIFPLEILPVAALGAALFHALVSLSILLCANLLINGVLQATVLLLPLVLLPLLMFALGLGWLLASLGVFVRDISYTIGLVVQALFFLTPIFYPLASVPPAFRFVLGLNPLAAVVENSRRVLLWGLMPDWGALLGWTLAAAFVMLLGYAFFMHTKHAFADVL